MAPRWVALEEMANRLAEETSPYLLQHKDNPVDWQPWGPEALERAAQEDKPILLSIGYSACHWCHVMERESFEDEETAALMNESFVPIKVDREERPDVDDIYMEAVQGMTGQGGWPLTVFLDPEGVPVLRRHLLPARAPPGDAELPAGARGDGGGLPEPARGAARGVGPDPRVARRRRPGRAVAGAARRSRSSAQAISGAAGRLRPRQRRLRRRAEVPAGERARVPARPRPERPGPPDARQDDARRHLRPARRRLRPLLGRRRLARPPLREDALRQRAAGARLPARLAGDGRGALAAGLRGDARLGAARDARARGRLLLGARRRLRGRGGPVLRLGGGRDAARRWPRPGSPRTRSSGCSATGA